jgi:hypothetical protein
MFHVKHPVYPVCEKQPLSPAGEKSVRDASCAAEGFIRF